MVHTKVDINIYNGGLDRSVMTILKIVMFNSLTKVTLINIKNKLQFGRNL